MGQAYSTVHHTGRLLGGDNVIRGHAEGPACLRFRLQTDNIVESCESCSGSFDKRTFPSEGSNATRSRSKGMHTTQLSKKIAGGRHD